MTKETTLITEARKTKKGLFVCFLDKRSWQLSKATTMMKAFQNKRRIFSKSNPLFFIQFLELFNYNVFSLNCGVWIAFTSYEIMLTSNFIFYFKSIDCVLFSTSIFFNQYFNNRLHSFHRTLHSATKIRKSSKMSFFRLCVWVLLKTKTWNLFCSFGFLSDYVKGACHKSTYSQTQFNIPFIISIK